MAFALGVHLGMRSRAAAEVDDYPGNLLFTCAVEPVRGGAGLAMCKQEVIGNLRTAIAAK